MVQVRRWHEEEKIDEITSLLHAAYGAPPQARSNFTADTASPGAVHQRANSGTTFLAEDGNQVIGIITLRTDNATLLFRQPGVRVIDLFAIHPHRSKEGVGRLLLDAAENEARQHNVTALAIDTAEISESLAEFLKSAGFREVGDHPGREKDHRSILMAKWLVPPVIRPCRAIDASAAKGVVQEVFREYGFTWDGSDYFSDLEGLPDSFPGGFWVAEVDGHVAGCGGLELHELFPGPVGELTVINGTMRIAGTDCELGRLYVRPAARRQGLASALTKCIISEAHHRGLRAMEIWSDKRFAEAHRLYEKLGARLVGERVCHDPDESPEWGFVLPL